MARRKLHFPLGIAIVTIGLMAVIGLLWWRSFAPAAQEESPDADDHQRGEVAWAFASQLPPDDGREAFVIQAGMLGEGRPRVDVEVPWVVDHEVDIARMPAASRPVAGGVVYVADDGRISTVQRLAIRPDAEPEVLARLDAVVWSVAAAPDGSAAYLALVERGRPEADLGVVRLALDGSGRTEPFLDPVALDRDGAVRLAAVAPFTVTLDISWDGRYLARTACRGAAGCETTLVDITTGRERVLESVQVTDLGAGGFVVGERCGAVGCTSRIVQVETGDSLQLRTQAYETTVALVDGRPIIVGIEADEAESRLVATDPGNGAVRELYRTPAGGWLALAARSYPIAVPDGAVLIVHSTDVAGTIRERYVLVPVGGGATIEFSPPAVRPIGPPGAKG